MFLQEIIQTSSTWELVRWYEIKKESRQQNFNELQSQTKELFGFFISSFAVKIFVNIP